MNLKQVGLHFLYTLRLLKRFIFQLARAPGGKKIKQQQSWPVSDGISLTYCPRLSMSMEEMDDTSMEPGKVDTLQNISPSFSQWNWMNEYGNEWIDEWINKKASIVPGKEETKNPPENLSVFVSKWNNELVDGWMNEK